MIMKLLFNPDAISLGGLEFSVTFWFCILMGIVLFGVGFLTLLLYNAERKGQI